MRVRVEWSSDYRKTQFKDFADYNELVNYCFTLYNRIILFNKQRDDEREKFDIAVEIYDTYRE